MVTDELSRSMSSKMDMHWRRRLTLCTTMISLSTSTERLFAATIKLYSGLECVGCAICSGVLGFASNFSISCMNKC